MHSRGCLNVSHHTLAYLRWRDHSPRRAIGTGPGKAGLAGKRGVHA